MSRCEPLTINNMKKIFKEIKLLMRVYKGYRLIVTNDIIELKITPRADNEEETNWAVKNNRDGKLNLLYSLQKLSIKE